MSAFGPLGVGIGVLLGALLAVFWVRGSWARRVAGLEASVEGERSRRQELEAIFQSHQIERTRLLQELASAQTELKSKETEIASQQEFLETTRREIEATFKAVGSTALDGNTRQFLD